MLANDLTWCGTVQAFHQDGTSITCLVQLYDLSQKISHWNLFLDGETLSIVRTIGSKKPWSSQRFGEGFAMKLWPTICRSLKNKVWKDIFWQAKVSKDNVWKDKIQKRQSEKTSSEKTSSDKQRSQKAGSEKTMPEKAKSEKTVWKDKVWKGNVGKGKVCKDKMYKHNARQQGLKTPSVQKPNPW